MDRVILGKTGLKVNKNGFGALPIQRVTKEEAQKIMYKAYEYGIDYFDTARSYTDSEEKIGFTFSEIRNKIYIATKTYAKDSKAFWEQLEISLRNMKTDYIDIHQFHNPAFCPKPGDDSGLYDAMLEAKKQGKIRFIGFTNHRLSVAKEAIESGLYDTLQFPFSYLAETQEKTLVNLCKEKNMGFVAMKALSGGLITDSALAYAYINEFKNVLPIWGIQKESELDEFLSYQENPPVLNDTMKRKIENEKKQLAGNFCRGCGYCLPCPAKINIPTSARMSLLLRRAVAASFLTEEVQEEMSRIKDCIQCGHCVNHCPYGLNTPELLKTNYEDYKRFV